MLKVNDIWQKFMKGNTLNVIVITIIAALIGLCSYAITQNADNPVEQAAEAVIDAELGLPPGTVDLTPSKKTD